MSQSQSISVNRSIDFEILCMLIVSILNHLRMIVKIQDRLIFIYRKIYLYLFSIHICLRAVNESFNKEIIIWSGVLWTVFEISGAIRV